MFRGGLVPEREALLKERGRGLNIAGPPDAHEFPASRRRVLHVLEHVRRVHEIEGGRGERKDRRFADNQFGSRRHHQGIAASFASVRNIPLQEVRYAGKGVVSWTNLQDAMREIGSSPPGQAFHEGRMVVTRETPYGRFRDKTAN